MNLVKRECFLQFIAKRTFVIDYFTICMVNNYKIGTSILNKAYLCDKNMGNNSSSPTKCN